MDGVVRIDRVVANLEVWLDASFPFAKMKVKVVDRSKGDFLAVPNLALRDPATGDPEFLSGIGSTIEEATDDLLSRFVAEVRASRPGEELTEADFAWSAPEDF